MNALAKRAAMDAKTYLNGIFAGLSIGIAGTVFLVIPFKYLGAFLFAFGLLTILCYQFKLFTGAVGYLAAQERKTFFPYLLTLIWIWLGNLTGCFIAGVLIRQTHILSGFETRVKNLCMDKIGDSFGSLFILAFFCGILMYIAVETFRKAELPGFVRGIMVFLCVVVFILSGFEHSIAGMFYFSVAGIWTPQALGCVAVMTLGNSLGGMLIPIGNRFRQP